MTNEQFEEYKALVEKAAFHAMVAQHRMLAHDQIIGLEHLRHALEAGEAADDFRKNRR